MIFLFLLATAIQPPQPQARPVPSANITVSERFIYLPHLPETLAKAHQEFGSLRTNFPEGLKDLERTLQGLYATPQANLPLPSSFRVPRSKGEEFRFLVSVVSEDRYGVLEEPFFRAFDEWRAVMVQSGLAVDIGEKPDTANISLSNAQEARDA